MPRIVVIGAGIGGLAAALDLAGRGLEVTVVERASGPGGKMREIGIGDQRIDSGPTVLTLASVFENLFADAGSALAAHIRLRPVETLARHAWPDGSRLDLFADHDRTLAAIAAFAGRKEAAGYAAFCDRARRIYRTLDSAFMRNPEPGLWSLIATSGLGGLGDLWQLKPFRSLWRELGRYFRDPRLRGLFARYATYSGASPLRAPATLMLIAHVEQSGVWRVEGGMQRLAEALATEVRRHGGEFRFDAGAGAVVIRGGRAAGVRLEDGRWLAADAVIANVDAAQIGRGDLGAAAAAAVPRPVGRQRSLSAVTWSMLAATSGFELDHHNVFFPGSYPREFEDIFDRHRLPDQPAVYVCARAATGPDHDDSPLRRLFLITNAPADGDRARYDDARVAALQANVFGLLEKCGLDIDAPPGHSVVTTPADFEARFPGTGGALYGRPQHGWRAAFSRPTARSRIPGLYLAGGSVHPGPGVPMVALGGRFAARAVADDLGVPA